ncbi:MAG: hypothetical protein KDJ65_03815 [Anaerolineae bacterium]|nr:hypothetical protein [Anaerolineae bacterium]
MSTTKFDIDKFPSDTIYVKQETTFSSEPPPPPKPGVGGCISLFLMFWFILGSCWIYSEFMDSVALAW